MQRSFGRWEKNFKKTPTNVHVTVWTGSWRLGDVADVGGRMLGLSISFTLRRFVDLFVNSCLSVYGFLYGIVSALSFHTLNCIQNCACSIFQYTASYTELQIWNWTFTLAPIAHCLCFIIPGFQATGRASTGFAPNPSVLVMPPKKYPGYWPILGLFILTFLCSVVPYTDLCLLCLSVYVFSWFALFSEALYEEVLYELA